MKGSGPTGLMIGVLFHIHVKLLDFLHMTWKKAAHPPRNKQKYFHKRTFPAFCASNFILFLIFVLFSFVPFIAIRIEQVRQNLFGISWTEFLKEFNSGLCSLWGLLWQ